MLQPIRFKNAEDLTHFLNRLKTMELIEMSTNKKGLLEIRATQKYLTAQLIKAEDANIYLLADILEFLKHASDEEIQASPITLSTLLKKPVTLAQLKAKPELQEQLDVSKEMSLLIFLLNPNTFVSAPCPSISTNEEIGSSKRQYNNHPFHTQINYILSFKSFLKSAFELKQLTHSLNNIKVIGQLPLAFQSADFIPLPNKDIMRITMIQELELKKQLLVALEQCEQQEGKDRLQSWIKEIEVNTSKIKEVFLIIRTKVEEHQKLVAAAKEQYQEFTKNDPLLVEKNNKIAALKAEIKSQGISLEKQKKWFAALKQTAVTGTFILIGLLGISALIIAPIILLFPASNLLTTIIGASITGINLSILLLPPLRTRLAQGLIWIKHAIERPFDSRITIKENQLNSLKDEESTLSGEVRFCTTYDTLKNQLIGTVIDHSDLIAELDADLQEINDFEAQQQAQTVEKEPSLPNKVSPLSMFHHQEERSNDELADNADDNTTNYTASGSF